MSGGDVDILKKDIYHLKKYFENPLTFHFVEGVRSQLSTDKILRGCFMKINQVEELVDITKKNIRFYEDQGLLSPERNPENGYREYSLKDVNELLKIKLLRKLAIPLEDIRQVQKGRKSLNMCFEEQSDRLKNEIRSLEAAYDLCDRMKDQNLGYSELKAEDYLEEIRRLEEGGKVFMDVSNTDVKKKRGAWIAALVFCLFIGGYLGLILLAGGLNDIPLPIVLIILVLGVAVITGCLVALKQRLNEIKGGEENEASKY